MFNLNVRLGFPSDISTYGHEQSFNARLRAFRSKVYERPTTVAC